MLPVFTGWIQPYSNRDGTKPIPTAKKMFQRALHPLPYQEVWKAREMRSERKTLLQYIMSCTLLYVLSIWPKSALL